MRKNAHETLPMWGGEEWRESPPPGLLKDCKMRLINCNFSPSMATTPLPLAKGNRPLTADSNRARLHQSLKKSYFYRKLLNKSIDSRLTSEEFVQYK
jgi:hypothetical protein